MIDRILAFSVRARWLIVFATAVAAAFGFWQITRLPIDVTPDITNKQVQINTVIPTLGPIEVEKRVTFPIETALAGLKGVESTRSFSRNGFSQVTAVFTEDADLYFMRQQVSERLAQARANLPTGAEPELGPVSTGLGEVFHYSVEFANPGGKGAKLQDGKPGWRRDGAFLTDEGERLADETAQLAYLRTVQDWIVRPQLRAVPGVADVDSLGGFVKQYVIEPNPVQLAAYGVSYTELAEAMEKANLSVGANYIDRAGEAYLVRADARLTSADEIASAVVTNRGGVPVRVKDLAKVTVGGELRRGSASRNGYQTVIGSALMLVGENSRTVAHAVGEKLKVISTTLPTGVVVAPTLDRSQLVVATITTVTRNLAEGALLVIALLFLLLGNWRAALIATLVFSPMVITLMLALASAFVLSLTFVPAMIALLVKGRISETEAPFIRWTKRHYEPWLRRAVARPVPFVLAAIGVFAAALVTFAFIGREFMPTLDEQNLNLSSVRIPSTSIEQSTAMDLPLERAVMSLPEVVTVYSKAGTASLAADPMPPNASDNYIILKPKKDWPAGVTTKDQVIKRIEEKAAVVVGNAYDVTQPIEMRFNELIGGVRSDVAVKVYGDDLDQMSAAAERIAGVLRKVRGAADVRVAQTHGFPTFDVRFDRDAIGRYGLTVQDVADTVSTALGGRPAGLIFEGDRRFEIVVRLPNAQRSDLDALGAMPVMLPSKGDGPRASVPLRQLASFRFTEGLNEVSRDNGKRRIYVEANVRGRDLGSFVAEAQGRIAQEVKLPTGSWLEWGGQFENLQAATQRLALVVPVCFVLIFAMLYIALGGAALAATVFAAVPLALAGGVFAIALRGIPFSVSAAVGFIAVSGVAVLNGLVLITSFRRRLDRGEGVDEAVIHGSLERLRPVLMTALVASLGFVPMAIATGTGAEVQRPLATVVIGGLITSTLLTLVVLPAVCAFVLRRSKGRATEARLAEADGLSRP